jgi:hypothetical protein
MEQMKDMLLTYNEYNKDLGYVQGMSDLLAPLYAVMQDDAVAFWAFVGFMDRMERNFLRDQSGMRKQLLTLDHLVQLIDPKLYLHLQKADSTNFFFFFRMLLVWYKREFEWLDILRLWESLWTDYLSSNFHLFIALAILEKHRTVIMDHLHHFDEVLKYGEFEFCASNRPHFIFFFFSQKLISTSQRAFHDHRPQLYSHPRRSPLPPLRTHHRSHRQTEQLPLSISSPAPTKFILDIRIISSFVINACHQG